MRSTVTPYAITMADILECIAAVKGTTWDASMVLSWLPSACYDAHLIGERDREKGEALLEELLHLERICRFLSMNGEGGEPRGIYRINSHQPKEKKEEEMDKHDKTTECAINKPQKEWRQLVLWEEQDMTDDGKARGPKRTRKQKAHDIRSPSVKAPARGSRD
jgi:hypothetical protein